MWKRKFTDVTFGNSKLTTQFVTNLYVSVQVNCEILKHKLFVDPLNLSMVIGILQLEDTKGKFRL